MVKFIGGIAFLVGTVLGAVTVLNTVLGLGIVSGFVEEILMTSAPYLQLSGIGLLVIDHVLD